jgi:hypothetical protein
MNKRHLALFAAVTLLLPLASANAQCTNPPSGLLGFWPGDGHFFDLAGTNHAAGVGGAGFASGEVGQAFDLDGSNAFVQVHLPSGLPLGNQPRTLMLWCRTPRNLLAITESALVQYGSATNTQMFGLITSLNAPDRLYFYGHNRDLAGTTALQANVWYHVAVTYDGTTVRLYVNGQAEGAKDLVLNTVLSTNGLTIGNRPGIGKWQGQLDEVMLFSRALSASEVAAIYAAGSFGVCRSALPPRLTLSADGAGCRALWLGIGNVAYQPQTTTNLTNPAAWLSYGPAIPGTNGPASFTFPITAEPVRFFRLHTGE